MKKYLFLLVMLMLNGCFILDQEEIQRINNLNKYKPVTVFVHGTVPPHYRWFIFTFDCPHGLTPTKLCTRKIVHSAIGHTLHTSNQEIFPVDQFYMYGWKSTLSFEKRNLEAKRLYHQLKQFKGPITLMGHSHGGNVILNLVRVARELGEEANCPLNIEKIILMAVPVQEDTKEYIKSPIFKKIYALYSTGDTTQTKDPQKLYAYMRKNYPDRYIPFCSGRTFEGNSNLKQIRMLLYGRNVQHLDFIFTPFLSRLPEVLDLIDTVNLNDPNVEYLIDVPRGSGSPILKQKPRNIKL